MPRTPFAALSLAVALVPACAAPPGDLAEQLRAFDSGVVVRGPVRQPPLSGMLAREHAARLRETVAADRAAWAEVRNQASWEKFRETRLHALRASFGTLPEPPKELRVRVTRTLDGDG